MKAIDKLFLGLSLFSLGLTSCSDFDEVNTDPSKTQLGSVKSYFALNQSFSKIQMDLVQVNVYTFITGEKVLVFLQRRNICLLVIMMMIISALFTIQQLHFL